MDVRAILDHKGTQVAVIEPTATVGAAVAALARHSVGALVVSYDGERVAGVISERDVVRGLARDGAAVLRLEVGELMTTEVQTCRPTDTVAELMAVMTDERIRHLPVVVDGVLAGIVSIGDVVKRRVSELESDTDELVQYLRGTTR